MSKANSWKNAVGGPWILINWILCLIILLLPDLIHARPMNWERVGATAVGFAIGAGILLSERMLKRVFIPPKEKEASIVRQCKSEAAFIRRYYLGYFMLWIIPIPLAMIAIASEFDLDNILLGLLMLAGISSLMAIIFGSRRWYGIHYGNKTGIQ